jgi:hypothetical protein
MKFKDAIVSALALVASVAILTGMAYSDQFQQAAVAENGGFDALAHDLFHGSKMACADGRPGGEGSAQ